MDQIIQNLSFEVVAVPQDVAPTTTSFTTPVKVKIKMKKGDSKTNPRQGVISVPRMKPTYPKIIRTVHSDETIMSFNINMKPEPESKPRRQAQNKFFHLFKTGKCLNTQGEDENDPPYMLTTPINSNNIKSEQVLQEMHDKKDKTNLLKNNTNIKIYKNVSKPPNVIFGVCKPGGCLDPPFGEENYQYYPSIQTKQELEEKEFEIFQKPCNKKSDEDNKSKKFEIAVKNSQYIESDASSTYMLYKVNSKNIILTEKYSDSIITYPTRTSSTDLSILEKSVMSRKSSSVRNRQSNIDTYYTPTKLRKSQEKNREPKNKTSIDYKNDNKEGVRDNLLSCTIPNTGRTKITALLPDDNVREEKILTNLQENVTQSNYKILHLVGVSEPTVNKTKELVGSVNSKLALTKIESKIEETNNTIDNYNNITENIISKTVNVISDEESALKIPNGYRENSEKSPNINGLPMTIVSSIITNLNQNKTLQMNKTKDNIAQKYIYDAEVENLAKITNIEENEDYNRSILDIKKPMEELNNGLVNVLRSLGDDKIGSETLRSPKDLDKSTISEFDTSSTKINFDYGRNHSPGKVSYNNLSPKQQKDIRTNSMIENNFINMNKDIETLKEANSWTKLNTFIDRESLVKDQSKDDITSPTADVRYNNNLLHDNKLTTERNISEVDNTTDVGPYLRIEGLLNNGNIFDNNTSPENAISIPVEDTSPTMLTKDLTTLDAAAEINTNNIERTRINKNINNVIVDTQNAINTQKNTENEKVLINEKIDNELAAMKLFSNPTEYTLRDKSSSVVSVEYDQVHKSENESAKLRQTYDVNEMVNDASPDQQILNENILPHLENQPSNIVEQNILNKPSLNETSKYLKSINDLDLPHYTTSKQILTSQSDKSILGRRSRKLLTSMQVTRRTNLDANLSTNGDAVNKEECSEIDQNPKIQYYNNSLDVTNNEKVDTKKHYSNSSLKRNKTTVVNMGFQTYVNDNGETILKTFDPSGEPQRFSQDRIFVKRSVLKLNDSELSFAINSRTRLSIKVDKTSNNLDVASRKPKENNKFSKCYYAASTDETTQRGYEDTKISTGISYTDRLQDSLVAVYENDLIPIERLIKSLRVEIDRIAKYRQLVRKKSMLAIKKVRPTYSKRCVCIRKWNNKVESTYE